MLLYHGSHVIVAIPNLLHCRVTTDFGKCFYTTTDFEQSEKWANIKKERENTECGYVSIYEVDEVILYNGDLKIFKFNGASEEWLDFVVANRRGKSLKQYDIVEGPVANDKLYATITLYEQNVLSAKACIEQLQTHKLFNQLSFNTERALKFLRFVEAKQI